MHFLRIVVLLLFTFGAADALAATYSTEFGLSADATSIRTLSPLHRGDRVQVQSPRLFYNEMVLLVQCLDGCAKTKIIRGWSARSGSHRGGPGLLEAVTLLADGDYYIAAYEIPATTLPIPFRGCVRSLLLHVLCSEARALRITESKAGSEWFRARLSSSSWLWARVEAKHSAATMRSSASLTR